MDAALWQDAVYEKCHEVLHAGALLLEGKLEDGGALSANASLNRYRSVLVGRMWPLESACGATFYGAVGHPGENPRSPARVK